MASSCRLQQPHWHLILTACLVAFPGCYELPPVIPPGYIGSPPAPGWPPHCVYDADPFALRNRWFHRQFSARARDGEVLRCHADEPLGRLVSPSAVDTAEILSILRALAIQPRGEPDSKDDRAVVSEALFRSDLLAEAGRITIDWPASERRAEIEELLKKLAGSTNAISPDWKPEGLLIPPPLRNGDWKEAAPPSAPGLTASSADSRVARLLRRESPPRSSALVRLRAAARSSNGFEPLPLASECWQITYEEGGPVHRVFRFDRAEWLQGRDPWRAVPDGVDISIRDPLDPMRRLEGPTRRLCTGCHCGR